MRPRLSFAAGRTDGLRREISRRRWPAVLLLFLSLGMVAATPSTSPSLAPSSEMTNASFDSLRHPAYLANSELRIDLTSRAFAPERLTVTPASHRRPLVEDAAPHLILEDGTSLDLAAEGRQLGEVSVRPVEETGLGPGTLAEGEIWLPRLDMVVRTELTIFDRGPYFTYRLVLPRDEPSIKGFAYLGGTILPGERPGRVTYLGDDDVVVSGTVSSRETTVQVGAGKPILFQGSGTGRSMVMALLDPTDSPSILTASGRTDGVSFRWEHPYQPTTDDEEVAFPRLLVQAVDGDNTRDAFRLYRSLMNTLYPPAPLPSWFRQQWISWYLYGMEIDEDKLKSQIDYIRANLDDVGPWSILVDAGWYVAEGRPDSDWRNVDTGKFPSGLRALVDYAHSKDVKVVLYFSASYVDTREAGGNWLGLRKVVEEHPEWLVPIENGDPWSAYYYDFSHPGFQEYMREILRDYFVSYGVDGIKVDGLMDTRLAVKRGQERGLYSESGPPAFPTTSLYAFIYEEARSLRPDVYLEAGWSMPAFSAPHFSVARQSDDRPDFGSAYPEPGLDGHVDYAIAQLLMLGQRPHLGNFWGDPNDNPIGLQWLEAGLALNAPVVLGFNLNDMSPGALGEYRARLTMLRPFEGQVHLPKRLEPDSFSAATDGTTFVALMNRGDGQKQVRADLGDLGLPEARKLAAYDVAAGAPVGVRGAISAHVAPEGLRLFAVRADPGVLWTNSSFAFAPLPGGLALAMMGPKDLPGFAYVATPRPTEVLIDGQTVSSDEWSYDAESGVLKVTYPHQHDGATAVQVRY